MRITGVIRERRSFSETAGERTSERASEKAPDSRSAPQKEKTDSSIGQRSVAGQDQERSAIGPSNPASGTFSLSLARSKRLLYPFAAIVGQERMLRALILNAINPSIGGVLIRGQKGTAKSTAVRGLAEVLPGIEVVVGCRFGCDPRDEEKLC